MDKSFCVFLYQFGGKLVTFGLPSTPVHQVPQPCLRLVFISQALRPNSFPERTWGAARRAPQQKPELRALSTAIHVVGERHTDGTRGTEGPAHQFVRLAFLGELVSLKVDEVTFWA